MKNAAATLVAVLLAVGAASSCSKPAAKPAATISVAMNSRYDSRVLQPFVTFFMNDLMLHLALYAPLFSTGDDLKPRPLLVERWEWRGKEALFWLKEGACFSNGKRITARDAVWSLNQSILAAENPNPLFQYIEGGRELLQSRSGGASGIGVIDDRCFFIRCLRENEFMLHYLAMPSAPVLPAGTAGESTVFSGPYMLDRIQVEKDRVWVDVTRNPHYAGKRPEVERIRFCYYQSPDGFRHAVEEGQPDLFLNFMQPDLVIPQSYVIFRFPVLGGLYILLNPNMGALRDREFRRTLVERVDFSPLIGRFKWFIFSPVTHVLPYGLEESRILRPLSPVGRTQLPLQKPVLKITLTNFKSDVRSVVTSYWQEQLKAQGIELKTEWVDSSEYWRRFRAKQIEASVFYYLVDLPEAIYFYQQLFIPGMELNFNWRVEDALQLLDRYSHLRSGLEQMNILAQLEEIARREALLIPVFNMVSTLGYKKTLRHVHSNALMHVPFEEITLEERD